MDGVAGITRCETARDVKGCSWSVYELADGSVWVSHMNIGMMAKMMGGVVGESMGGVAKDDERFLQQVLH